MTAAELASRLDGKRNGSGSGWAARCPAHEDRNASLSISEGADGRVLLKCHAGCDFRAITAAACIAPRDLFPPRNGEHKTISATYDYTDEAGALLLQVVRFTPKAFKQRRPDGKGGWIWNLQGTRRVLYRLPEVVSAVAAGQPVVLVEGEKDVAAMVGIGFCATCNVGGAGKWAQDYTNTLTGSDVIAIPDRDAPGHAHVHSVGAALTGAVHSYRVVELPSGKDAHDWIAGGGTAAQLQELIDAAPEWEAPVETGVMATLRNDPRPSIQLPGDERLLSDFATELGKHLRGANLFTRSESVVTVNATGDGLRTVEAAELRTWVEKHLVCYKAWTPKRGNVVQVLHTMSRADADGVAVSPQFHEQLRPVERFAPVRMPVLRGNGSLELLPCGYDEETHTFTAETAFAPVAMPAKGAASLLRHLLGEFVFADNGRSLAVAIGAMMTVYGIGLLPSGSLRPVFFILANAEGAGKTLLVKACCVPILGNAPVGSRPRDEDELRKTLVASVVEARPVVFFDNLKGHFGSEGLEAFVSAETFGGRILGQTRTVTAKNNATVFLTGNGCTVTPDMRRRSLFAELFLEHERAEDRVFNRELDVAYLTKHRAEIVGALWSLIQGWDAAGRPSASRSNSSFPAWARIIGGVVEHAGFTCPLETPAIQTAGDTEGDDMRALVEALLGNGAFRSAKFEDLVAAARENGLFPHIVPGDLDMDAKAKSRMGRLLQRYDRRLIGGARFILEGKGHSRRFRVERADPTRSHGQHGSSSRSEFPIVDVEHPERPCRPCDHAHTLAL